MSFYYKLTIAYQGQGFCGWQQQKDNPKSIEETLKNAIASILGTRDFKLQGASRTDAGVHALGQVAKLILKDEVNPIKFIQKLNSRLISKIRIMEFSEIHESFNANRDSKSKSYSYYFSTEAIALPMLGDNIFHVGSSLNTTLMEKACELLIGNRNFINFGILREEHLSPYREIFAAEITEARLGDFPGIVHIFKIQGSGFLKYMVRYLMGALIQVGRGEVSLVEFEVRLQGVKKPNYFKKAPAHGLYLANINY